MLRNREKVQMMKQREERPLTLKQKEELEKFNKWKNECKEQRDKKRAEAQKSREGREKRLAVHNIS